MRAVPVSIGVPVTSSELSVSLGIGGTVTTSAHNATGCHDPVTPSARSDTGHQSPVTSSACSATELHGPSHPVCSVTEFGV